MDHRFLQSRRVQRLVLSGSLMLLMVPGAIAIGQGYGQYYGQNFKKYGGQLGTQSTDRYLYDKYFYHRPSVSPYLNLDRPDTMSGTSYQAYVRPEQQRREATMAAQRDYIAERKREGRVGDTRYPGAIYGQSGGKIWRTPQPTSAPSAYYNHWYGNWAK
jgi:hypothetical protein